MYLIMHENGSLVLTDQVTEADKFAHEGGYVTLIDVSEADNPKVYAGSSWDSIRDVRL